MQKVDVQMSPKPYDTKRLWCSQGDTGLRKFGFHLMDGIDEVDISNISDPVFSSFNEYVGGTEELLPTNASTPSTSPILADIQYSDGLREDQSFTYRESPANQNGLARIDKIKGNTLVWNQQLLKPTTTAGSGASVDGSFRANRCTYTYDSTTHIITITALENVGSSGFVFGTVNGAPLVIGHKYLQMCDVQAPKVFNFAIGTTNRPDVNTNLSANTYHHVSTIKEFQETSNEFRFNFNSNNAWEGTETVYIKNAVLFDLTQMFGAGNEPTVEEFTSLFPLPYYDYNVGTLLPFKGEGIKTVGKNFVTGFLADSTTANISWTQENGVVHSFGLSSGITRTPTYTYAIPLKKGSYILSGCNGGSEDTYGLRVQKNNNGTWAGVITIYDGEDTFTLDEDAEVRVTGRFSNRQTTNYDVTFYPMIRYADAPSGFEPYTENTTSLPISTYFPTGMKSAGNVYDELTSNKAVTRVGTRAYQSGDESDSSVTTDGTNTNYALSTPVETSIASASLVTERTELPLYVSDGLLVADCTEDLSSDAGIFDAKIRFTDADGDCYSNKLKISVEARP